ncbi:hypothetical protein ACK3YY_07095 [Aeromonas caviae]
MAALQADMMGRPFDPELAVIVTFFNGADPVTLEGGLEPDGHNIWRAKGVKGVRYNPRGVPIINEYGEIQRPAKSMACNVNPPTSFEKFDPKEEEELRRKEEVIAKARRNAPAIKPDRPQEGAHPETTPAGSRYRRQ